MALAGLLAAVSPVLGGLTGGGSPPDTSSAQATVTTNTNLTTGPMTQGGQSALVLLLFGLALYWAWGYKR